MRSPVSDFFVTLVFLSILPLGVPQVDGGTAGGTSCALDDSIVGTIRDEYDACQGSQGAFGNWKVSQRCVADYYRACEGLDGVVTRYCTVVRSTKYAFGVCLNSECPRGNCTGPYQCDGAEEEMRKLVGTLDETDVWGCCGGEKEGKEEDSCFGGKSNAAAMRVAPRDTWLSAAASISGAVTIVLAASGL